MATRPLTFAYPAPIITAGPRARCPFRSEIPQDIRPPGPAYARGVRPLRFGLSASTTASRREWQELARRAEAAGFDVLQVADHLDECLPPLTALCSAADVTERLHVGTLTVIHGHGSGALRRAVRDALKEHAAVASFDKGPDDQGGNGITVVTMAGR